MLSLENKAENGWLKLPELLETIDLYYDTHLSSDKPRSVQSAVSKVRPTGFSTETTFSKFPRTKFGQVNPGNFQSGKPQQEADKNAKLCYVCGSYSHLAAYHGKPGTRGGGSNARRAVASNEGKLKSVNECTSVVGQFSKGMELSSTPASVAISVNRVCCN